MKINKKLLLILAVFLIAVTALLARSEKKLSVAGHKFEMELADSEEKRQKGLSGRDGLCNDCAMLFIFEGAGQHGFWMEGMKFPLDIIWVSENNKIVHIEKNISPDSKSTLNPPVMADKVIEISAKLADEYGFRIGDEVIVE